MRAPLVKGAGISQSPRMQQMFLGIFCAAALSACAVEAVNEPSDEEVVVTEADEPLMSWPDLTNRPLPVPDQTISYGALDQQVVDIWIPEADGPHPVVLMVHGGCWQKAIADRTLMNYAAADLRARGIAVWNIEYRGVDEDGGGYPGTFKDVAAAAKALSDKGPEMGLNTDRIIGFGHSAGGHLVAWLATQDNLPSQSPIADAPITTLYGIINSGGLADLEASEPVTLPSCLSAIADQLTGPESHDRENVYSDTSPAMLQPSRTIQYSVNGARDRIAPPQLGIAYTALVNEAGGSALYEEVFGGHVELISPGTYAWEAEVALIELLLEQ